MIETEVLTRDGRTNPYEFRSRVTRGEDDELVGVVGIGRDIAERKRQERQVDRQAWQFEEVGIVLTHDLRNPLNVAAGHVELTRAGDESALDIVAESLDRLDRIIDDFGTVVREGAMVSDEQTVEVAAIFGDCRDSMGMDDLTLDTDDAPTVVAGPDALQRALENLLQNADRHGGDTVRVGSLSDGFYVEDDGPGIPEGDRERIFDPGHTTGDEGTGFGLVSGR